MMILKVLTHVDKYEKLDDNASVNVADFFSMLMASSFKSEH